MSDGLEKNENNKILSKPILVKGIPRIGWFLNMLLTGLSLNIFGLLGAVPTFAFVYIFLFIKAKYDPDFLNINAIKNIKIDATKTHTSFKGNKYVS